MLVKRVLVIPGFKEAHMYTGSSQQNPSSDRYPVCFLYLCIPSQQLRLARWLNHVGKTCLHQTCFSGHDMRMPVHAILLLIATDTSHQKVTIRCSISNK